MVKKLFLITGFLVLAVVAGLLSPMPQNLISSYQGLPFKAYCPMYNLLIPTPKLSQNIDRYTEQWGEGFSFSAPLPSEKFACAAKVIMDRGENYDFITTPLIHVKSDRPDLYAYFTQRLFDNGGFVLPRELSNIYYIGEGVPKDKEKAKHLLRLEMYYAFPSDKTGEECIHSISQYIFSPQNDFETEQINWFQKLCTAPEKELYEIAVFYMERESGHFYPEISQEIYSHLYFARGDEKAWTLYKKAQAAKGTLTRF